jgi:putative ubiquitin-RnfH superfamily antitoxin RatB of RatAB toxin-antitoxin module
MRVTVLVALPGVQEMTGIELPAGATVAHALAVAGIASRFPLLAGAEVGVWGRRRRKDTVLREGDRVEIYRPLRADAKAMRRARVNGRPKGLTRSPR